MDLNSEWVEFIQCACDGVFYPADGVNINFENLQGTINCYQSFVEVGGFPK